MIKGKTRTNQPITELSGVDEEVTSVVESASAGTIDKVLGLNTSGKLVKGEVSAGTKLYQHYISFSFEEQEGTGKITRNEFTVISNSSTPYELDDITLAVGNHGIINITGLNSDDIILPATNLILSSEDLVYAYDAVGGEQLYTGVDDFYDEVSPL